MSQHLWEQECLCISLEPVQQYTLQVDVSLETHTHTHINSTPFNTSLTSKPPSTNAILENNLGHALSQERMAIRPALFVLGNIDLTNNTVKLEPFMILPVLKITPSHPVSKFAITLLLLLKGYFV